MPLTGVDFSKSVIQQLQDHESLKPGEVYGLTDEGRLVTYPEHSCEPEHYIETTAMTSFVLKQGIECGRFVRTKDVKPLLKRAAECTGSNTSDRGSTVSCGYPEKGPDETYGAVGGHKAESGSSATMDIPDGMFRESPETDDEPFDINKDELYLYISSYSAGCKDKEFNFEDYIHKISGGDDSCRKTAGNTAEILRAKTVEILEQCDVKDRPKVKSECYKSIFNALAGWTANTSLRFELRSGDFYQKIQATFESLRVPDESNVEDDPLASATANELTANLISKEQIRTKYNWLPNIDNLLPSDEDLQSASDAQHGDDPDSISNLLEGYVKSKIYSALPPVITQQIKAGHCLGQDSVESIVQHTILANLPEDFATTSYSDVQEPDGFDEFDGFDGFDQAGVIRLHNISVSDLLGVLMNQEFVD